MKNFIAFIREQGIVGLAIAFIMGSAIGKVVSSLVADIIQPIIGIILGSGRALNMLTLKISNVQIRYGNFLAVLIDFVIIAAVVYWIFKRLKLDNIDKQKQNNN